MLIAIAHRVTLQALEQSGRTRRCKPAAQAESDPLHLFTSQHAAAKTILSREERTLYAFRAAIIVLPCKRSASLACE